MHHVARIGRELDLDYVVEGTVRRDGDRVRISVQLIQVGDQTQLWAESYDREAREVIRLQTEVAQAIAQYGRIDSYKLMKPFG